jgi:hypothetical protein
LPGLRKTLRRALDSGHEVFVDLSEVTFLDALCLRELVVQYRLQPCLSLWHPSSEVKLALAICNLENWVRFRSDREVAYRPRARTGVVPRGDEPEDAVNLVPLWPGPSVVAESSGLVVAPEARKRYFLLGHLPNDLYRAKSLIPLQAHSHRLLLTSPKGSVNKR